MTNRRTRMGMAGSLIAGAALIGATGVSCGCVVHRTQEERARPVDAEAIRSGESTAKDLGLQSGADPFKPYRRH
jgi:hypothetical protein